MQLGAPGGARPRTVPGRWPRPAPRAGPRKEIVLRAAVEADAGPCAGLDASYATAHVWQLETRQDGDELRVCFRPTRLPRELTLVAEHRPPAPAHGLLRRGALWLVAEEIDVEDEAMPAGAARYVRDPRDVAGGRAAGGSAGKVVGYIAAAAVPDDANAYLRSLVVDPAYRRRGIASRLLAEAARWAAGHGAVQFMADVPARNYPALQLLQQAGFAFCGYNDRCYPNHEVAIFLATRLR